MHAVQLSIRLTIMTSGNRRAKESSDPILVSLASDK